MYFVLDLVCVLIIGICVVRFFKSAAETVLMRVACVLFSALLAVFVSIPCASLTNSLLVAPLMEKNAAYELADMVSAEHKQTGRETVKDLNIDRLVTDCPPAFKEWVEQYQGDLATVCFAYRSNNAQAMLVNLISPLSRKAARGVSFVILWVLCFLVLRYFAWRLESNSAPKPRQKGDPKNALPPLFGGLYGLCVVWGLVVALQWLVPPLSGRVPLVSVEMLTKGFVYPLLRICDPLYWLARI